MPVSSLLAEMLRGHGAEDGEGLLPSHAY